jgi:hypothetical protein
MGVITQNDTKDPIDFLSLYLLEIYFVFILYERSLDTFFI